MTFKIGLVQVSDRIATNLLLPLAIGVLWTSSQRHQLIKEKWRLESVIYEPLPVDEIAIKLSKHDMVCFSTYIWNADYHINLAQAIKKQNPKCFIVFGGPHFSERWPDFWNGYRDKIDLVLLGEGEESFSELLLSYPDWDAIKSVPGSWSPVHISDVAPRTKLDQIDCSPYLEGFYDQMVEFCHDQSLTLQATLQTNRGCPYHCTFCEEGNEYKNKIYQYPLSRIMEEIEWCGKNKIEYLNIADDNFGILDRDIDIMEKICITASTYGYPKILDATYAKNHPKNVLAIAELDKKHGTNLIRGITVALQSTNHQTLKGIKRFNLIEHKQAAFISELKKNDMPIYAEMIWPLPFETYDSLCTGIDTVIEQGMDNWIGLYPLSMQTSANLYHDFGKNYQFAETLPNDDNSARSHVKMNNPMSSDWATHKQVVRGHVFYMWLTSLYFFGFARPVIDALRKQQGMSVSKVVNDIMDFIDAFDDQNIIKQQHQKLHHFWEAWLTNRKPPLLDVDEFSGYNTDFWYPYTHHASWLQLNHDTWIDCLSLWTQTRVPRLENSAEILERCKNSVVRFKQKYPYRVNDMTIDIKHTQPNFENVFEFCRYYYWYNRKKGHSRTIIES